MHHFATVPFILLNLIFYHTSYLRDLKSFTRLCSVAVFFLAGQGVFFATPLTVACQAPLSMGFPRQEYPSRLSFSSPGDLPNPEIESVFLSRAIPALAGRFFITYSISLSHQGSPHLLSYSII